MEQRDVWSRGGKIVDRPPNKLSLRVRSFSTHSLLCTNKNTPDARREYTHAALCVCFFSSLSGRSKVRGEKEIKFRVEQKRKRAMHSSQINERLFIHREWKLVLITTSDSWPFKCIKKRERRGGDPRGARREM